MSVFLTVVGFLGTLVSSIILIIFKKEKNNLEKPFVFLAVSVTLLLMGLLISYSGFMVLVGFVGILISGVFLGMNNLNKKPLKIPAISLAICSMLFIVGMGVGMDRTLFFLDQTAKNSVSENTKVEAENSNSEKKDTDKATADKAAADKAAADKAAADKAAADKAAADKAAADKAAADKAAADKAAADKAAADKAAADKAAAEQAAANMPIDENGNEILPANTQWVSPMGHIWVGVDLYYLNTNKEGIKYATILSTSKDAQQLECYMYESDTVKTFNRYDPQFTGTFLHVRADDPHLQ